jgi:hypothetical protein
MQHDAVIASRKAWFFDCYCKCYSFDGAILSNYIEMTH